MKLTGVSCRTKISKFKYENFQISISNSVDCQNNKLKDIIYTIVYCIVEINCSFLASTLKW